MEIDKNKAYKIFKNSNSDTNSSNFNRIRIKHMKNILIQT